MQNVTNGRDDEAVARFVERFALIMVDSGMQRMPARVFGALLANEDGRATAAELAEFLRVSPAAISGAVRYLVQVGLILRRRDPGERRDHFEVVDDLWYEAFTNRQKLFDIWSGMLAEGIEAVGRDTRAGARLELSKRFFEFLRDQFPEVLQRWHDQEKERSEPPAQ